MTWRRGGIAKLTSTTIYEMTARQLNSLKTRGNTKLNCYTCSKPIKVGQEIVSSIKTSGRRLRHVECAKKVGIL